MYNKKLIFIVVLILLTGCSQNISRDTTVSNNTNVKKDEIVQQSESDHFIFYTTEQEKSCIKDLSKALEDNYLRITTNLDQPLKRKVEVHVYPDLTTFHKAIGNSNAPEWVVGVAPPNSNKVQMVSPVVSDLPVDLMKVVVHEFTHIVIENINANVSRMPIWLNEGIAVYESGQSDMTDKAIESMKEVKRYPKLDDIDKLGSYDFGEKGGYQISYLYIKYIVETYGYEKLIAIVKQPSQFENILGVTKEEFSKAWFESF